MTKFSLLLFTLIPCLHSQTTQHPPPVPIKSLKVTNLRQDAAGSLVHATLTSFAERPIVAYAIRPPGDSTFIVDDLPPLLPGISPGGTTEFETVPKRAEAGSSVANADSYVVVAALFDDGTTEGSPDDLARIADLRAGQAHQLNRLMPMLDALLDRPDGEFVSACSALIDQIGAMNLNLEDGTTPTGMFAAGIQEANGRVVHILGSVRQMSSGRFLSTAREYLKTETSGHKAVAAQLAASRIK